MTPPDPFATRRSPAALVLSIVVHLLVAGVVLTGVLRETSTESVSAWPGLVSTTRGGGGGGVALRYVALGA
ncbi:MAG: hypothetical protein ABR551_09170, partial [Gemmatimonadales bacterium]